ncbi:MAG: enoyl-CoA hydratase/isomerase family protein [Alphaproteobacteria bacterium]|nr:enoyl-CoA hydratase/isomerase family protein [Alphaproteobacteria bacterium]
MEEQTNNIVAETQENIGIITLNRPDVSNAISLEMLNDIAYQVQTWEYDEQIRAIIIKGHDSVFAAGIDIQELNYEVAQQSFALKTWQDEFTKIANCAKPIIAAVSGYALGIGCDLVLSADIILAAESAQFGYPETSIGMIPAFGGCSRLIHTIGKAKTMEAILTGKAISAQEAEACGLISRIVPLQDLESEAVRVANRIASLPFQTIVQAKETIKQTENMSLRNGMELESKSCRLSLNTVEFKEKLSSLSQKM